jgi:hypothetical protein
MQRKQQVGECRGGGGGGDPWKLMHTGVRGGVQGGRAPNFFFMDRDYILSRPRYI